MNPFGLALRQCRNHPGFAAVTIATLALGLGANTAIFHFVDQLLIRPLPVSRPEELVVLGVHHDTDRTYTFNYPLFRDLRAQATLLADLAAYQEKPFSMATQDQVDRVRGVLVSENYFELLGLRAPLGRLFHPNLDAIDTAGLGIVLSHEFWTRRFGADPSAVGRHVTLNSQPFTVIGVAPEGFRGTAATSHPEVYVPIVATPRLHPEDPFDRNALEGRFYTWLYLLGRVQSGHTLQEAEAQLQTLVTAIAAVHPDSTPARIVVEDGRQGHHQRLERARIPLLLLQLTTSLIVLLACANVANLLLARATTRRRELAVRLAIGASRGRLAGQFLAESFVLSLAGGAAALLFAAWLGGVLARFSPPGVPLVIDPVPGVRAVAFTFGLASLTSLLVGLLPALHASKPLALVHLKTNTAGGDGGQPTRWDSRRVLAAGQIAISALVLVLAGLCLRSAHALHSVHPGYDPSRVLLATMDLDARGLSESRSREFYARLIERVRALPGVDAAGLATTTVLSGSGMRISIDRVEGYEPGPDEFINLDFNVVSPGYFAALGLPLLRGRDFGPEDTPASGPVVVVNETLAQRYWPGQDPLGKRLLVPRMSAAPSVANAGSTLTESVEACVVVGVVGAGKHRSLTEAPVSLMYRPLAQHHHGRVTLHLRTRLDPRSLAGAVSRVVHGLDPYLPVFGIQTLGQQRITSLTLQRLVASLLAGFGVLACLLSALGIYGVVAYRVACRTREIGLRMALGGRVPDILRLVLTDGCRLAGLGLGLGLAAAWAVSRLLAGFLFGVTPGDPPTFLAIAFLLMFTALAASALPALRAARVDPMSALRTE